MEKNLSGKRALITGASSGIGASLAERFAREGANLIITARRKERLDALAAEVAQRHGVDVQVIALDLGEVDAAQVLFDQTEQQGHRVDILVNNAGFGAYDDFINVSWERHVGMMQLNMVSLTQLTQLYLPGMVARGSGNVMNIGSTGAYSPCPNFAVYAATKAYVRNFTEALDYELKGTGVRAIVVNPGGTYTGFLERGGQTLKKGGEFAMMTSDKCADIAVKKMLSGRRNVVVGFLNALSVALMRFLPRAWLPGATYLSMKSAVEKTPKRLSSE